MSLSLKPWIAALGLSLACASSFAVGTLDPIAPSASFSNTVTGAFTDVWTFNLGSNSIVAASITNVEISFGAISTGGIEGFTAWLNGVQLFGPSSTVSSNGVTVSTQVVSGSTTLAAGLYELRVSGTGVTGGNASYGGNIVATAVPEPASYALLLGGLGVVGLLAKRRRRAD